MNQDPLLSRDDPGRTEFSGEMGGETIVALYDTAAQAESVVQELKQAGVPGDAISLHADEHAGSRAPLGTTAVPAAREQGFWASLFGGEPDHDTAMYDRSLAAGATAVTVRAPGTHVAEVLLVLERHHPVDIDERASTQGTAQGTRPAAAPVATGADTTMQLSEESLSVGKRVVNRGGTRIRRFVVETPVQQDVTLHDERVTLERRPVTDGRAFAGGFSEKTIEMTATAEEAVVSKTARVYEEVGLRKEATERVETVRDTVRKEEAAVEQIPGLATETTAPRTPKI